MKYIPNEDLFESTKMTFGEHLDELRTCLVRALLGLAIGFLIGLSVAHLVVRQIQGPLARSLDKYYFDESMEELAQQYGEIPEDVAAFMRQQDLVFEEVYCELEELNRVEALRDRKTTEAAPTKDGQLTVLGAPGPPSRYMVKTRIWKPQDAKITSLSAHEPFMIWVKAALVVGAIVSSPWVFLQIWNFVAAGLYPHEKSYVHIYLPFSLGLFLAGAALAFFFVFDPVLNWLFSFNKWMNIDPDPRISEWMSFVLMLPLGFGISFQLPLVMLMLERIGVMSVSSYLSKWRISILVIFVVSMILTPADPVSMLLMACPLTVLYFGGIGLCRWMPGRRSPYGEGYDPS